MLLISITCSLAALPSMLERIDSVTNASRNGLTDLPTTEGEVHTSSLLDRAQGRADLISGARAIGEDGSERPRVPERARLVRVLGPDD